MVVAPLFSQSSKVEPDLSCPGDIVANIASKWLAHSAENVEELRQAILAARSHGDGKHLAHVMGWDPKYVSDWLNHNDPKPDELRYYKLLKDLARSGRVSSENYDNAFEAISNFLEFDIDLLFERRANVEGDYVVYRYSMLAPGHILKGSLNIKYDNLSKALKTQELYRIPTALLTEEEAKPNIESLELDGGDFRFPRNGYFFARGENDYILISKKPYVRPVQVQTIYFDDVHGVSQSPERRKLTLMYGRLSDWHGRNFYSTRVVAVRRSEPLNENEITALEPNKINASIREFLTRRLDMVHDYLVQF